MAGENQNQESQEEQPRDYVTKDDVAQMITGAVNRISKDLQSKQEKSLSDISAQLKALAEAKHPPAPEGDDVKGKEKADPKVAHLERQLSELQATLKATEQARQQAEQRAREDSARSALKSELAKTVRPEMVDTVAKILFDAERRVSFDEDGTPLFTIKHSPVQGMSAQDTAFTLSDGLGHWLKSDEAKFFLPAPGGGQEQGRGPQGPRVRRPGNQSPELPPDDDEGKIRWAIEQESRLANR